jgi:hypothetical protein
MDYLRALLVPFHPTILVLVTAFALLMSLFLTVAGLWGILGIIVLHIWVLKYCFVLIEHMADGAREPPVLDVDMLSPTDIRPWVLIGFLVASTMFARWLGEPGGYYFGTLLLLVLPAIIALMGMGDNFLEALNPVSWWRVISGFGPLYFALLAALFGLGAIDTLVERLPWWRFIEVTIMLLSEITFFSLIGSCIWLRRIPLGFEPSRSPERTAARAEAEGQKERAKMLDHVFEQVRLGKHVDATAPLANWLRDADVDVAVQDSLHVADQAVQWKLPSALNPIGSTLIRHLLRFGRPDVALRIYEKFRRITDQFTMDSAPDLRVLSEYAESVGKVDLAQTMRLETPVFRPPGRAT